MKQKVYVTISTGNNLVQYELDGYYSQDASINEINDDIMDQEILHTENKIYIPREKVLFWEVKLEN